MKLFNYLVETFGAWLWFMAAVALMVLETFIPGIHFVWFGVSAAIVGVIALLLPIGWQWQLILFTLIALASVYWMRRSSSLESAKSDLPDLNIRGAQYIGRRVVVSSAIVNGRGRVRVGDTNWPAEGEDAEKGTQVKVTGVNDTVLVVERIES